MNLAGGVPLASGSRRAGAAAFWLTVERLALCALPPTFREPRRRPEEPFSRAAPLWMQQANGHASVAGPIRHWRCGPLSPRSQPRRTRYRVSVDLSRRSSSLAAGDGMDG